MQPTPVLATVSGRDRPGVAASLFAALAAHDVDVRDVEQLVIRDRLLLAVLLDARGEVAPLREALQRTAHALGMEAEVVLAGVATDRSPPGEVACHVTVVGRPLRPGAISAVAARITDVGGNIDTIATLTVPPWMAVELLVTAADATQLRRVLVDSCADAGLDMAVRAARHRQLATRLVVLTSSAVLVPTGADHECLRVRAGAPGLVAALKRFGYRVGFVGSDTTTVADPPAARLGVDFAAADHPADALREFAARCDVPISQTVAVASAAGAARDLELLDAAGVGIVVRSPVGDAAADRAAGGAEPAGASPLGCVLVMLGIDLAELSPGDDVVESDLSPASCG